MTKREKKAVEIIRKHHDRPRYSDEFLLKSNLGICMLEAMEWQSVQCAQCEHPNAILNAGLQEVKS